MKFADFTEKLIERWPVCGLAGRRRIETTVREITADNVKEVVGNALAIHSVNAGEITYLYNYYKGIQDIQFKKKVVRTEINNRVCVNRANEIVTFKTAYFLSEPIQYISHGGNQKVSKEVYKLNEYMRAVNKEARDKEIVDWMHICGIGERFVFQEKNWDPQSSGSPFDVYTIDPRDAFVIYSARIGKKPLAGVILQTDDEGNPYATVYTKDKVFEVTDDMVTEAPHVLGGVPLIEYENNSARMGAFESVISILNNINTLESSAVDAIEDFVNGFDVFQNCEINDGDYSKLSIGGNAVMVKTTVPGMEAKVYRVTSEISQSGVQSRVDDLTDAYLTICGMPNRNGGSSTSDTGTAVIFRDGFAEAESRAADTQILFKRSEMEFDKIVLNICRTRNALRLNIGEIEPDFPRAKLSNLQTKVQVLCEMLNQPKIHPKYAFSTCGVFDDSEEAYRVSAEHYEEYLADKEETLLKEAQRETAETIRDGGQGDQATDEEDGQAVGANAEQPSEG